LASGNILVSDRSTGLYILRPSSASFSIPASPGYIGLSLFHQWAVLDPINSLGIVVSDAGKATIDT
jgi:hypothetical protein